MYKGIQPYLQVQATLAAVVNPTTAAKVACTCRYGCIPLYIYTITNIPNLSFRQALGLYIY